MWRVLLALLAVVLIAPPPAAAKGIVASTTPPPKNLRPGQAWDATIKLAVRMRSGKVCPIESGVLPALVVQERTTGRDARFEARATGKKGVYEARVTFPDPGEWSYFVDFAGERLAPGRVTVAGGSGAASSLLLPWLPLGGLLALGAALAARRLRPSKAPAPAH